MTTVLVHTPADIIRYLLIAKGIGVRPSDPNAQQPNRWPIFANQEPSAPNNVLVVYDTQGISQGRMQKTGETAEHYGFQVLARASDTQTGRLKLQAVENVLLNRQEMYWFTLTIGTEAYMVKSVTKRSGIITVGRDPENLDRFLCTLNCTAVIS